jgi:hypothetical protein
MACRPRTTLPDPGRGGRAAEGTRLLSEYGVTSPIEGSNPSLSVSQLRWMPLAGVGGGWPRPQAPRAGARPVPTYLWFTSSAIQVFGPTIPSCANLYFFWKLLTAASVAGPNFPSTASFVKPYSLRSCH